MKTIQLLQKNFLLFCLLFIVANHSIAQTNERQPNGGGSYKLLMNANDEISLAQRAERTGAGLQTCAIESLINRT
jgi:hypothetical protein